jgi:hypothetical protein
MSDSSCPYKSISFPWISKDAVRKTKSGKDIGNSDVPEFSAPSSLPFLYIIREPSKGTVHVLEFRNEVFHKDVCLYHVDYIVFLVLSFAVFHSDVSKLTDMRTSNRPVG